MKIILDGEEYDNLDIIEVVKDFDGKYVLHFQVRDEDILYNYDKFGDKVDMELQIEEEGSIILNVRKAYYKHGFIVGIEADRKYGKFILKGNFDWLVDEREIREVNI